ncbi:MAG: Uma2 family endonuclease, partial [Acidobacteria bacterium]|nr:Uma2 family endonuclease [Acidobacteriota bacterium]
LREGKFLVPDIAVQRLDAIQDPYPELPIYLCVEILSPGDRLGETLAKGEAYHDWGVPYFWVVDPETRQAWSYANGEFPKEVPADGELTAGEISISMVKIFSVL